MSEKIKSQIPFMLSSIWCIKPVAFGRLWNLCNSILSGGISVDVPEDDPYKCEAGYLLADSRGSAKDRRVGLLRLRGILEPRLSLFGQLFGGTSTDGFSRRFEQMINDDTVSGVLIDVDSPGGVHTGTPELADQIFESRSSGKPIIAISNYDMASAAYWIGSSAHRVYSLPSGETGSVGVFASHMDFTGLLEQEGLKFTLATSVPYKAEFHPLNSLSDETKEYMQSYVDDTHKDFVSAVSRNRGVSVEDVDEKFGKGRMLTSKDASKAKMIDRITTMSDLVSRMQAGRIRIAPSGDVVDDFTNPLHLDDYESLKSEISAREQNSTEGT